MIKMLNPKLMRLSDQIAHRDEEERILFEGGEAIIENWNNH